MSLFECCLHCSKRCIGCHAKCPEYKKDREILDKRKEAIKKSKYDNNYNSIYYR